MISTSSPSPPPGDPSRSKLGFAWAVIVGAIVVVAVVVFALMRGDNHEPTGKKPPEVVKPVDTSAQPPDAESLTREQIGLMNQWAESLEKMDPAEKQAELERKLDSVTKRLEQLTLSGPERAKLKSLDAEFDQANARLGRAKADTKRP